MPELQENTGFSHKDNFKFHTSQSDKVFRPSEKELSPKALFTQHGFPRGRGAGRYGGSIGKTRQDC